MEFIFRVLCIYYNCVLPLPLGDGRESRQEYTSYICDHNPALYQLSHYLYDEYDVNGDHHLELVDYEGFHALMDVDSKAKIYPWTVFHGSLYNS